MIYSDSVLGYCKSLLLCSAILLIIQHELLSALETDASLPYCLLYLNLCSLEKDYSFLKTMQISILSMLLLFLRLINAEKP